MMENLIIVFNVILNVKLVHLLNIIVKFVKVIDNKYHIANVKMDIMMMK